MILLGLTMAALFRPIESTPPGLTPLVLQLAPPPPAPLYGGDLGTVVAEKVELAPVETALTIVSARIPDEILSPAFDVPPSAEEGFLDGSVDGMPGGIVGGAVGGVPGGLVGGVVGGTGTELRRFPTPDVGPSPIRMPQPSYTREAIRDNVTGTVVLRVVIDEQGKVQVLKVLRSIPELDEEAIRVVESRWRFQPATKNGRPVPALSDLVVRFNLY
ncbi:MAG: energy transducer TonB [Vicinamibacteria bacterium]